MKRNLYQIFSWVLLALSALMIALTVWQFNGWLSSLKSNPPTIQNSRRNLAWSVLASSEAAASAWAVRPRFVLGFS